MKWFRGLAGLAIVKWLGTVMMRWMSGRSQTPGFDPNSSQYPQPYQPQHQHPYPPPPQPQESTRPVDPDDPGTGQPVSPDQPVAQQPQAPPPQYYNPGPGYPQQPPPRKRKRRGCLIFGLLFVALLGVGVMVGLPYARDAFNNLRDRAMDAIGMGTPTTEPQTAGFFPVDDESLPTRDVGVGVRDNHLTFTLVDMACQSGVCLARVGVENTGTEPRHFVMGSQWVIDADGFRHPGVDWRSSAPLPDLVVPGDSLEGEIVFNVPGGATIIYAQLHESPFSPGVLVDLR